MKNYFDEIIQVDNFLDKIEMSRTIENIMCRSYIKALYAAHEWVVEICGYLREKYSINGINEMVAKSTRDKFLMKTILSNAGIKTAKVQKVKGKSDVEEFALKNRFPVVVKPQSGAATQNTFIIRSNNDKVKLKG
jgi:biotin carboxylase